MYPSIYPLDPSGNLFQFAMDIISRLFWCATVFKTGPLQHSFVKLPEGTNPQLQWQLYRCFKNTLGTLETMDFLSKHGNTVWWFWEVPMLRNQQKVPSYSINQSVSTLGQYHLYSPMTHLKTKPNDTNNDSIAMFDDTRG